MADLSPRQQQVYDYLREHPWATRDEIARALDMRIRAVGNVLARMLEDGAATCREIPLDRRREFYEGDFEWAAARVGEAVGG